MKVEQDFTSKKLTLVFETGEQIELDKRESEEFRCWFDRKKKEVEP